MKILNIIFVLSLMLIYSCGNDYVLEDNFDLEDLPGYVAFDAPGNDAFITVDSTSEDAEDLSFKIECPTGTLSDITVKYDLGGSAVMGVDYNIENAGNIVLKADPGDFENRDNVELIIDLLTDDAVDGTKDLTITLTSASNADGTVAVGRGGTDFLKSISIPIKDID